MSHMIDLLQFYWSNSWCLSTWISCRYKDLNEADYNMYNSCMHTNSTGLITHGSVNTPWFLGEFTLFLTLAPIVKTFAYIIIIHILTNFLSIIIRLWKYLCQWTWQYYSLINACIVGPLVNTIFANYTSIFSFGGYYFFLPKSFIRSNIFDVKEYWSKKRTKQIKLTTIN